MDALTINEASVTTGWSPRMLRYIERAGLVEPARSDAGYRLYGPAELQKLRTLRELLRDHEVGLTDLRSIAILAGHWPERRALIGIQPQKLDWGDYPTPEVAAAIPAACRQVNSLIDGWLNGA